MVRMVSVFLLVLIPTFSDAQSIRTLAVDAADLVYSPLTQRLYASRTATGEVVEIEPASGSIGAAIPVGSQPGRLAISDNGEYLFVALAGLPGIVRVHLPSRVVGMPFTLGDDGPPFGARAADDIEVLPGTTDSIAVSMQYASTSPRHAGVAILDGGVPRPTTTSRTTLTEAIEFGATASQLYGYDNESNAFSFRRLAVATTGVTIIDSTSGLVGGFDVDIESAGGRLYSTSGQVVDPEARTLIATLPDIRIGQGTQVEAFGDAVYYLTSPNLVSWEMKQFSVQGLMLADQQTIAGVSGTPRNLVSWGTSGLAFSTSGGQVFLIDAPFLFPGTPLIEITTPSAAPFFSHDAVSVTLGGTASDSNGTITRVAWSSDRGYSGAASGTTAWYASDIPLVAGTNVITVTATDDTGLARAASVAVNVSAFNAFLAEGATGTFFDFDLAIANPHAVTKTANVVFFTTGGSIIGQPVTLQPFQRQTLRVDAIAGLEATTMSTNVQTTSEPLVVERTMRWDGVGQYGAHSDKATAGTARRWYFAEGSQGFFFTYLLLANPNPSQNTATVDWLIEGSAAVQRTYALLPYSRTTVDAGADPALVGRSFGIVVTFATPGVAERTMYFGAPPDVLFKAGHNSAGVTAPSSQWFLAEGATGPFFETFILLANPNPASVDATLTFLPQSGQAVTRTVTIPASGRQTINIEALSPAEPSLANAAVATSVNATLPIVVERAQYWPGPPSDWYEAHNSFGVTGTATRWGLAEGRVGNPPGLPPANYQTYVLLANAGDSAANVTVLFLREAGPPVTKQFVLPATSRRNVAVGGSGSAVPELSNETFGVVVTSDQPIAVERAMYGDGGPQIFGIGTNVSGTRLP